VSSTRALANSLMAVPVAATGTLLIVDDMVRAVTCSTSWFTRKFCTICGRVVGIHWVVLEWRTVDCLDTIVGDSANGLCTINSAGEVGAAGNRFREQWHDNVPDFRPSCIRTTGSARCSGFCAVLPLKQLVSDQPRIVNMRNVRCPSTWTFSDIWRRLHFDIRAQRRQSDLGGPRCRFLEHDLRCGYDGIDSLRYNRASNSVKQRAA